MLRGSLREKSSTTLRLPSLTHTLLSKQKRQSIWLCATLFLFSHLDIWTLKCTQIYGLHQHGKNQARQHDHLIYCWGRIDLRCTVALQQSLVCLADVASWLNMLCWIALSTKNYTKANDEIFPDTAKESQPSLLTLKWSTISLHQLSIWTLWFPTFSSLCSCKTALVELEASVLWISADWQ